MTQLGIPGVAQALHDIDGRDPLDRYYTPGLLAHRLVGLLNLDKAGPDDVVEPSVGGGAFARSIYDHARLVAHGYDIDEGATGRRDCIFHNEDWLSAEHTFEWAIGNPPYFAAEEHARHSLSLCSNVAFLLRLAFLESKERVQFWQEHPARKVWVLAERPSFRAGATDSCAYGFFLWSRDYSGPTELEVLSWR